VQILEDKKLENASVELTIEIPQSRVDVEYKSVFERISKNAKVDGFRRGKAPVKLVENMYREQADREVLESILKATYFDAVQEKNYSPIGEPHFDVKEFDKNKSFTYSVRFEIMPSVEPAPYKELESKERACEIKDKDVEREIDDLREKSAKISKKEDGASVAKGDVLRFGVKRVDNVTPEEAEKLAFKEYNIIVGKSESEFALDKFVIGMKVGETREIPIKYPKDYEIKDLAGQKVRYLAKAEEISSMELPKPDDEFAKDVSDFQTIQELRANIRETMERYVNDMARNEVTDILLKEIIDKSKFDIPESMVQGEMRTLFSRFVQRMGVQAKDVDELAGIMNINADEFKARLREESLNDIKSWMVRLEIAKKESITFTPEDYESMVQMLASQSGKSAEEMGKKIEESGSRENIETELVLMNVKKYIYENAKIKKQKPVTYEEFIKKK
jgi:trigger factor